MTPFAPRFQLHLLGGFELRLRDGLEDQLVPVTGGSQRLTAFLALHNRQLLRTHVAGTLWPDVPTQRANANLRAALWRLPPPCRPVIDASSCHLRLAAIVAVDLHAAAECARRLLDRSEHCSADDLSAAALLGFSRDLLPDWYDDWVLVERERFHQLRLHALETLCERLTAAGRYGEAVDAGLAAVRAEPLRESGHRALIRAYTAEGNHAEAGRQYDLCRRMLLDELGVEPSVHLRNLVLQGAMTAPGRYHA
jgi:DNA-binding SARP family transcriptional activator